MNVVRIFPQQALNFAFKDTYKLMFLKVCLIISNLINNWGFRMSTNTLNFGVSLLGIWLPVVPRVPHRSALSTHLISLVLAWPLTLGKVQIVNFADSFIVFLQLSKVMELVDFIAASAHLFKELSSIGKTSDYHCCFKICVFLVQHTLVSLILRLRMSWKTKRISTSLVLGSLDNFVLSQLDYAHIHGIPYDDE